MRVTVLLITLFAVFTGWPARQLDAESTPPAPMDVPLCQLLADPGAYTHQVVQVTGRVRSGFAAFQAVALR